MKRKTALLLAILFLLSLGLNACGGETTTTETTGGDTANETAEGTETTEGETKVSKLDPDTLVVGTPEMNGDFVNGFTNSSYDVAIKSLIGTYGNYYGTYGTTEGGEFVLDQTVNTKDPEVSENADGSKTYKFFLNPELVWSDGQPITAKDYVFSVLFAASPQWLEAGAGTSSGDVLKGYVDYHEGKTPVFEGVKYIDDQTFEITIDKQYVPYYYETALASVAPDPMHRFAPDMQIGEEGSSLVVKEGYTIDDAAKGKYKERLETEKQVAKKTLDEDLAQIEQDRKDYGEADYPQEAYEKDKADTQKAYDDKIAEIDKTLADLDAGTLDPRNIVFMSSALDVAQTYRYAPDVTCGPYKFVSYENQTATITINDKFLGDYMGRKPTIKNIVQKQINQKTDVDLAIAGEVDIVEGIIEGEKIEKAKAATDSVKTNSYGRNGYGKISFLTDLGNTKYKEVRQAIGYLMDRNVFVQNVLGGYGAVVNGEYGLGQWMYAERGEELEEKLNHYTLNIEKANELLDKTPFKFEKDGKTPWDAAKAKEAYDADSENFAYYRYDDKGNELVVNHFGTAENTVTDTIAAEIPNNGKQAGLRYNVQFGTFDSLLEYYYHPNLEKPEYTAFNLATTFANPPDPYYQVHSTQIGNDNRNRVNDPAVDKIVEEMRYRDPADREGYLDKWVEYEVWWNDYMPEVPLYSNEYYDVYGNRIENFNTSTLWPWYRDAINMTITK